MSNLTSFSIVLLLIFLPLNGGFQIHHLRMNGGVKMHERGGNLQMISNSFFNFGGKAQSSKGLQQQRDEKRVVIEQLISKCQPNGLVATKQQRVDVDAAVKELEKLNPTKSPALSQKMNGFWRLLYTDFDPPATSAGKLGPLTGTVYQDLDGNAGQIINYLKIGFPKIEGGLVARQSVLNPNTWQIDFDRTGNYIFGLKFQSKKFVPASQIRLWKITYLDDEWRIMRGRRPETPEEESFIFILQRDEANRFDLKL